nr:MAG TPA: hypothetical protein [Caudoviricetes sp.]DAL96235.1 MAG TPA: hypothetical protein [Caudoviricetes sp.]DAV72281.1 MAG TPA: hypothetical protein [Caudoviricetes sp.]
MELPHIGLPQQINHCKYNNNKSNGKIKCTNKANNYE